MQISISPRVSYSGDILTLNTERKDNKKHKDYHRVESYFGSIQRSIHIPKDIEEDRC